MRAGKPQQADRHDKFVLRFEKSGQRDELKIRAIRNGRSTNAELLHLIERGMEAEDGRAEQKH